VVSYVANVLKYIYVVVFYQTAFCEKIEHLKENQAEEILLSCHK
jgi:hypothetical protein